MRNTVHVLRDPVLPCPDCRMRGHQGRARIGNRRRNCPTCNLWAANVTARASRRLRDAHPEEFAALVRRVELDLYPAVIERHARALPVPA